MWQVRDELGEILCGDASECQKIDTGGYKVTTSLDYRMQRIVEKWAYVAAIVPNAAHPDTILKTAGSPAASGAGSRPCGDTTSTTTPPG